MKIKVFWDGRMYHADVANENALFCYDFSMGCLHEQLFMSGETCRLFHEKLEFCPMPGRTELYKRCQACLDAEVAAQKMEVKR